MQLRKNVLVGPADQVSLGENVVDRSKVNRY